MAVYAALLAAALRRGALPVDGEWGRSVTLLHGPVYPSVRHGTGKRVTVRLSSEESGYTRVELVAEHRLGDIYLIGAAAAALSSPLLAALSGLIPAAVAASTAAASSIASMLTLDVDINWCSSLIEEACMEAPEYREIIEREVACRVECSEARGGYACSLEPLSAGEVLAATLSIIGFNMKSGEAEAGPLRVTYRCSPRSCTLLFRGRGLRHKPTIYTAILVSMLAARLAC